METEKPSWKYWTLRLNTSDREMKTITPAETARDTPKLAGFVTLKRHLKNKILPPKHVAKPAAKDNPNANPTSGPVSTIVMKMRF